MHARAITVLSVAGLFTVLTACSSDDDDKDAAPRPTTTRSAEPTAPPQPKKEDTAALEAAVRGYTAAYFKGDVDALDDMLSRRCGKKINRAVLTALTERAVGDHGHEDVKRFKVDRMAGNAARVSYGVGEPRFDHQGEPWLREGGEWRYDRC